MIKTSWSSSNFDTQFMIYTDLIYTNERHTGRIIYLLVWLPELHKKGMRLNGRNWDQPTAHFSSRCSSLPGWLTDCCLPASLSTSLHKVFRRRITCLVIVEKILKGSLDSILSPTPSVKIQIMDGKICLRCKGKTLLGVVNKLLKTKSL